MTEEAWLKLTRLDPLLTFAIQHTSVRRVALFACGCCRCAQDWSLSGVEGDAIHATERYRDGEITRRTWLKYGRALEGDESWLQTATGWECDFRDAVHCLFHENELSVHDVLLRAVERVSTTEYTEAVEAKLCGLLRDVFGNPFRPVSFSPAWRTENVVLLARQMYESRDFGAMPILADALQDAGCENEEILSHCRDANQVHVRGCWVVDLVLGKE